MPTALLSVYDKTGLIPFARGLHDEGFKLMASGSTAKVLRENDLPVMDVADYTRSPEMLNGRVKTLHPAIHGGLLARNTPEDHQELLNKDWDYIDLVAVNLYPFTQTVSQPDVTLEAAIEQIDIGGVTLIRAAAKNYARVTVICDPADYDKVLSEIKENKHVSPEMRKNLAVKGFSTTTQYDTAIAQYLDPAAPLTFTLYPVQTLRYGENPHQSASLYSDAPNAGPLGGNLCQGKALSYNNILDLDAAFRAAQSYQKPTICIVKHLSPCGLASANSTAEAFQLALACDPVSAFGGIIASNKIIDEAAVEAFGKLFIECIAAPGFTPEAREMLAKRPQCRLLEIPDFKIAAADEWRSLHRSMLRQSRDCGDPANTQWKVVTAREPAPAEWAALHFAWQACQHVKSNAIVFAQGEAAVGIGGGQPNRIDCVRMAGTRAGIKAQGAVMASDAFFPFADGVEEAIKYGISAIIQPGGSVRDAEVIQAANAGNISMVLTGVRHFRH
jgi:phosphoribosylaminoimidazolecarboxamide formyltransferase/IMP cyclohydrolase